MEDEKDRKRYVTRLDLLEHGDKLKKEIRTEIKEVDKNVDELREDMGELKDLVLPISGALQQIVDNTKETAVSLKGVIEKQQAHDIEMAEFRISSKQKGKKREGNTTIIVAIIGGI
ncbi:hypothetical protein JSO03_003022, partial [Listeria innocua]|nr:hypothetical protein [Listeria innocua]